MDSGWTFKDTEGLVNFIQMSPPILAYCPEFWRTRKVEINLLHGQHPSERFDCDWTWFIGRDRLIQVHFHGIIMDELKRLYILSIWNLLYSNGKQKAYVSQFVVLYIFRGFGNVNGIPDQEKEGIWNAKISRISRTFSIIQILIISLSSMPTWIQSISRSDCWKMLS